MPAAVALDSLPLQGWDRFAERYEKVFQARTFETPSARAGDTPFAYWRPLEGNSVVVGHPGAMAGMTLRMRERSGELGGTILAFTDVMTPGRTGRDSTAVRIMRTPCDSLGGPSEG